MECAQCQFSLLLTVMKLGTATSAEEKSCLCTWKSKDCRKLNLMLQLIIGALDWQVEILTRK